MKPSSRTPLHQTFLTLLLATAAFSFDVSAADAPPATFATVSHLKGEVTATASTAADPSPAKGVIGPRRRKNPFDKQRRSRAANR